MKLLCSILVAVLMLGNIAYAEVIDDEKVLFQTVIGNDGLKIADIAEDDVITREEMVDILINLTQIQKDDIENIKFHTRDPKLHIYYYPFNDWPVEENKEKLLERLYECAIIKGCDDNMFRPYDACTIEEAITFIVRGLGWGVWLIDYEYPHHYIEVAEEIGLCSSDDINIGDENTNLFLAELIFKSLFIETVEMDLSKYNQGYRDYYFDYAPCALGRYHELGHTYGYATNHESGIKINDVIYQGKVSNNESFDEGYVLCIYDKSNYEAGKSIVLCLEISAEIYEKYKDKDINRGRACEIADEFFVEIIGTNFITEIAEGFPRIKETDNAYSIYRSADKLGLYKEGTVVVDKKDGSIISFTAE